MQYINKTNLTVYWGRGVVKASMYLLSIQHYSHENTHLQFQKLPSDPLLQTQQKQKPKKQKLNSKLRSESSPLLKEKKRALLDQTKSKTTKMENTKHKTQ